MTHELITRHGERLSASEAELEAAGFTVIDLTEEEEYSAEVEAQLAELEAQSVEHEEERLPQAA